MYLPIKLTAMFNNRNLLVKRLHIAMHRYFFILFFFIVTDFCKNLSSLRSLNLEDLVRFVIPIIFKRLFLKNKRWVFPGSFYVYCSNVDTRFITLCSLNLGIIPFAFLSYKLFINFWLFGDFFEKSRKSPVTWPVLVKAYNGLFIYYFSKSSY